MTNRTCEQEVQIISMKEQGKLFILKLDFTLELK